MNGYIFILTDARHTDLITLLSQSEEPTQEGLNDPMQLRYVAYFKNTHIAYMHVHNTLKRQLNNINNRTYRTNLIEAIAAIEAEDLKHERVWIDPNLSDDEWVQLQNRKANLQTKRRRFNRNYLIIGALGILFLFFLLLGGILHV